MLTKNKMTWQKELRGAELTHAEFRVLVTISTYADAEGRRAHPGWDRITVDARVDKRTAQRAVKSLIGKKWLILVRKGGNQVGYRIADEYELTSPNASKGGEDVPLPDGGESLPDQGANDPGALRDESRGRVVAMHEGWHGAAEKGGEDVPPSGHIHQVQESARSAASSEAEPRGHSAPPSGARQAVTPDSELASSLGGEASSDPPRDDEREPTPPPPPGLTWNDLRDDFDLLEEWLDQHLGVIGFDLSTASGMWEDDRHPKAIFNTIRSRRNSA